VGVALQNLVGQLSFVVEELSLAPSVLSVGRQFEELKVQIGAECLLRPKGLTLRHVLKLGSYKPLLKLQGARLRLALRNLLSDGDDQRFVKDSKQFFINLALTRFIVPVSILQSSASAL
jgi:hypothetical protein